MHPVHQEQQETGGLRIRYHGNQAPKLFLSLLNSLAIYTNRMSSEGLQLGVFSHEGHELVVLLGLHLHGFSSYRMDTANANSQAWYCFQVLSTPSSDTKSSNTNSSALAVHYQDSDSKLIAIWPVSSPARRASAGAGSLPSS